MATKNIEFDKAGIAYINKYLAKPIKNAKHYFFLLAQVIDRDKNFVFQNEGARSGHPKWKGFSLFTLHPSWKVKSFGGGTALALQKWNKRPGTDGAKTRRYNKSSKLLQASGEFKKSFYIQSISRNKLKYGSRLKLAGAIMSNPDRPVLFYTESDKKLWGQMFNKFYKKGLVV